MKAFISIFLALLAAVIVGRLWNAYGMRAVWIALACWGAAHVIGLLWQRYKRENKSIQTSRGPR